MKNGDYILVKAPQNYPGKTYYNNYCYEHHIVWWREKGEILDDGEVLHHKNEDKTDNRIENLEKLTNSEHTAKHNNTGRDYVRLECPQCGEEFEKEKRQTHLIKPQDRTFCSRSCSGKYSRRLRN